MAGRRLTGVVCAVATLFLSLASARKLQQTATTVPTNATYGNTLQTLLNGNASALGPIVYKTYEAGYFALAAEVNILSAIPPTYGSRTVALGDGSQVVVAVDSTSKVAMLGFSASDTTLQQMLQPVTTLAPLTFLSTMFANGPPEVNPAVLNPFEAAEQQIVTTMDQLMQGQGVPERIVCSGHAGGGAWAQICGVWAQVTYPSANIRVITFGAPLVGNEKWVWTFDQFVDLPYVWVTSSDTIPTGPSGGLLQVNMTRVIQDNSTVAGQTERVNSLGYYCETLLNILRADGSNIPLVVSANFSYSFLPSEAASAYAPPPGSNSGIVGSISSFVGNARDSLSAIGSTVSDVVGGLFGGSSPAPAPAPAIDLGSGLSAAPTPGGAPGNPQGTGDATAPSRGSGHGACEPFLCKIEPAIQDSCMVYNNGPDNIGVGSINIGPSPKYGTDMAVDWNETSKVASLVWRGSSSTVDWVQDFKLWLTEAPTSNYFQELYPGTHIHAGFLEQFQEVVSNTNKSLDFPYQLQQLMGAGTVPVRLDVSGHSLGAGVASICAVWASLTWPTADVRLVTFGSPKVGNRDWAMSALATVGRSYRVVNQLDEVPALPPITDYLAIDTGMHIHNGTITMEDRPATAFNTLTWDDHGCDDHYLIGVQTATNVTIPDWVLALPPPATQ